MKPSRMIVALLALLLAAPLLAEPGRAAAGRVGGGFHLKDAVSGKPVDQRSFDGKFRLVFFGFTHCATICPLGLRTLHLALEALGPAAAEVVPLFITIDPERDSPALMRDYAGNFDARIRALVGSRRQTDAAMKAFRLEAEKIQARSPNDYQMEHPAIFYWMDRKGAFIASYSSTEKPDALAQSLIATMKGR